MSNIAALLREIPLVESRKTEYVARLKDTDLSKYLIQNVVGMSPGVGQEDRVEVALSGKPRRNSFSLYLKPLCEICSFDKTFILKLLQVRIPS